MAKILPAQCRRPRLDLWSGNWIPHATAKLRPGAAKYIFFFKKSKTPPQFCKVGDAVFRRSGQEAGSETGVHGKT